jgi:fructoselysine 3-epimerase
MNLVFHRYPLHYFLESTARLGFDAIELWGGEPHLYVDEVTHWEVDKIKKEIASYNLETVCFTPEQCNYPINIAAKDTGWRKRSISYFKKSIDISTSLDCQMVLVSAGWGFFNERKEEVWERAKLSLQEITHYAGNKRITLVLEAFFSSYANTVVDLKTAQQMIREISSPYLKVMLDTPCIAMAGDTIDDYFANFGRGSVHIHFTDGQKGNSSHLSWGDGIFNLPSFQKSLERAHYDGYLSLEIFGNQYNQDPEKCVSQSLTYIKENWC